MSEINNWILNSNSVTLRTVNLFHWKITIVIGIYDSNQVWIELQGEFSKNLDD